MTGLHYIEADLDEEAWVTDGVLELEAMLARRAAFHAYLEANGHEA